VRDVAVMGAQGLRGAGVPGAVHGSASVPPASNGFIRWPVAEQALAQPQADHHASAAQVPLALEPRTAHGPHVHFRPAREAGGRDLPIERLDGRLRDRSEQLVSAACFGSRRSLRMLAITGLTRKRGSRIRCERTVLATFLLAAIEQENARHEAGPELGIAGPHFNEDLESLKLQAENAERQLADAAQRTAQVRYGRGMLWGAAVLVLVTAVLAGLFAWADLNAADGVAVPAGGLGAIVSVLHRMTAGRLSLDHRATKGMLTAFGAVRPLVGAVLGVVLVALVEADLLLSVLEVPEGKELPFYAALGFIAGFNERFAQDMLATAVPQPGSASAPSQAGRQAP